MKNLLLSMAMLCTIASLHAQLYVTPNTTTSTDSYIYVDDQVLFVEQDINLVANTNDPTTEASIYLRNQSQLVQGTTGSTNTGSGFISVFQDSNSDAYDYNYWASPVGNFSATGNRNFGLRRVHDSITLTDSNQALVTTNFNGSSSPLTISTRWVYRWIPATQRWAWNGDVSIVPPGYGFIMKGTDVTTHGDPFSDPQNQLYDFRGRPYNGDITLPVQTGVASADGQINNYTLSGNPYPSALDLKDVFYDSDNSEIDSFRYWDEDRSINSHLYIDNKGGYGTWIPGPVGDDTNPGTYTRPTFYNYDNGGGQGSSTGVMGAIFQRRFAPIGQGFMIVANATGSITIKNSHREYMKEGASNNSQFRNPNGGGNFTDITGTTAGGGGGQGGTNQELNYTPQIRVVTVFGADSHMRDMVLMFHDTATDGYDRGMDATHPMDAAVAEAYFPIGDRLDPTDDTYRNLVIQTVPFEPYKMVPIAFTLEEPNAFRVIATEQINTPFEKAYLFDSETGGYQEITDDGEASMFLPAGEYEGRFFITFRGDYQDRTNDKKLNPAKIAQDELAANVLFFQNNPVAMLEVSNPEGYDIKAMNIFDMSGKLVLTQENMGTQRRLAFPTANFSDGVYLVKLTTTDDVTIDHKISVFNK